jgi:exodeoxyribonuclease III
VNSLGVRLPQVLQWLAQQADPGPGMDVLALQELKLTDDKFPLPRPSPPQVTTRSASDKKPTTAWPWCHARQPADVVRNIPGFADEQSRVIAATYGEGPQATRVIGAYFPNGQAPGSDKFAYKMQWLGALHGWVQAEMSRHPNLVLMGDFNITFDDADVWDPVGLHETIHCTTEERQHLQALIAWGCTTPTACSRTRQKPSAGGTTACWVSRKTGACASTTFWSPMRSKRGPPPATWTARRAKTRSPATTHRWC